MADRHVEDLTVDGTLTATGGAGDLDVTSLDVGGGYGYTGATLSATGTISADSLITADGGVTVGANTLAAARLTLNRTTSNVPFTIVDETASDSDTVITVSISDGAAGANNVNGDQRIQFSDGTQTYSFGQARNAGVKSFNISESGTLTTGVGFRLNADTSVDLPEGDVTVGTATTKQAILDLERGAAGTKPG